MDRYAYPYVTGPAGNRMKCQLRDKVEENGEIIYIFLMESSGDTFGITKKNNEWVFVNGNAHLDHWIQELGKYLDDNL